jgi:DNA-binding MarR family transcriptional regulator
MARHGCAPSESDIHEHFMVSAPSAHQMVKNLEQRGFISRRRDVFTGNVVPRSIRIMLEDL